MDRYDRLARMCEIRYFEEELIELRKSGEVVGSVHLCSGQEALYVGAASALRSGLDAVFPTYRGHGWALALGSSVYELFSELMGRETGTNGGRGGSAYLSDPKHDMYGENSIVGAGAPIAAGAALASKFDGSGRIAVASFGDGAINQGAVSETLNFASVLKLPMIFVIENNGWSEMTPIESMTAEPRLFKRATAFGMTGGRVDGNDVHSMKSAVGSAIERIEAGRGPVVIEAMTDRLVGHYIGDVQAYRPKDNQEQAYSRDPIIRESKRLNLEGEPNEKIEEVMIAARQRITDAAEAAKNAPIANAERVLEHLYG